jgi:hypothetical protein
VPCDSPSIPLHADCQLNANQLSLGAMRNVWTQERDEELIRYKAAGLSASKIAGLLHTTRGAILGRSNRLRRGDFKSSSERLAMRKIAMAKKRQAPAAERCEKERAHQDATLAAMRADLAAGADLDVVVKRAFSARIKRTAVAEFLGLSRQQVYKLAGLERVLPSWTRERVKLLVSLRSDHSAQEIADALGTTRGAVLGKIWRMGLRT